MGAAVTSISLDDIPDSDRLSRILLLKPSAAFGIRATDRVSLELPISVQSSKSDNDDRFTEIDFGVRPVITISGSDAFSGVVTFLARLNRQSYGGQSSTRLGWEVGAGPEFRLNDALRLRTTAVYGSTAEDEDVGFPKESYYGLNFDLIQDLSAPGPRQDASFILRTGAAFTSVDPDVGDGETTIEIPSPYLGGYFNLSDCGCIRIGGEVELSRLSQGDFSQMDFTFLPAIEYDVVPSDRFGFRVRAFGLLSRQSFSSGSFDESGTITGFGGGVAGVLPMFNRYNGVIGLDYLKAGENEDLGFPSSNVFRVTFGIELPN
ncbi:MAG TPA: hypothetical protein VMM77_07635 [Gemmatimonadaceae bacterium]|nr:hypothetical protein [Gemmatimonadaceae bacterium]